MIWSADWDFDIRTMVENLGVVHMVWRGYWDGEPRTLIQTVSRTASRYPFVVCNEGSMTILYDRMYWKIDTMFANEDASMHANWSEQVLVLPDALRQACALLVAPIYTTESVVADIEMLGLNVQRS